MSNGTDHQDHDHDHHGGLNMDIARVFERRQLLKLFAAGAGLAVVGAACSSGGSGSSVSSSIVPSSSTTGASTATPSSSASSGSSAVAEIPEETAGPYPGDGSNGVNVLTESGIVRSDIRSSFGSSSGVAEGVPLTIKLKVADVSNGGAALDGAAVYLWHCDREGRYSLYSQGVTDENYLRGVQETDTDGMVTFTSIYPACYSGRWPHIHFEVYPSLDEATSAGTKLATSQVALTEDVSDSVYATDGYEQSISNMKQVSLATDMVFRDGAELETPSVSGSVGSGLTVTLTVGV
jgi:protocatechuate 3,4-dioxygenase beta subunit